MDVEQLGVPEVAKLLGISQQLAVEKLFPRVGAPTRAQASSEIVVKSEKKKGTRS